MTVTLIEEFYSPKEYDKEVDKIIAIDDPFFAAHFYMAVSKAIYADGEETVSDEGYNKLCAYLAENFKRLTPIMQGRLKLEDLENNTCTLVEAEEGKTPVDGVNFYPQSQYYLEEIEVNMTTDFSIESWCEANASTN